MKPIQTARNVSSRWLRFVYPHFSPPKTHIEKAVPDSEADRQVDRAQDEVPVGGSTLHAFY